MEMIGQKTHYVVEHLDSHNFFLVLDFADAYPEFTRGVEFASKYNSLGLAESVIERIRAKGLTMQLEAKPLRITYEIGEVYHETE